MHGASGRTPLPPLPALRRHHPASPFAFMPGQLSSVLSVLAPQVHFIIASCENMVDAKGCRPGDILVASNGKVRGWGQAGLGASMGTSSWLAAAPSRTCGPFFCGATANLPDACIGVHSLAVPLPTQQPAPLPQTVEINNTDAEGRLTLADALLFAQNQCGAGAGGRGGATRWGNSPFSWPYAV